MVVTHEKPLGSRCRYWSATSRRKARNPEFRSGISVSTRYSARRRMAHLAGTRANLCGALLRAAGADDLVVALERLHELGDALVGVGHVDVGPHDHVADGGTRPGPSRPARTGVALVLDQPDAVERPEHLTGAVGGAVVDADELVGVRRSVERLLDTHDLLLDVPDLVVGRQDDRDVHVRADGSTSWFGAGRRSGGGAGGAEVVARVALRGGAPPAAHQPRSRTRTSRESPVIPSRGVIFLPSARERAA